VTVPPAIPTCGASMAHDLEAGLSEQSDAAVLLGTTRPVPPLRR
jgi:hypothetical protein